MMDFFTGKLQDLGLKFSHETPKVATGGLAYKGNFFFLILYTQNSHFDTSNEFFKKNAYLSILLQWDMNRFQYDFLTL